VCQKSAILLCDEHGNDHGNGNWHRRRPEAGPLCQVVQSRSSQHIVETRLLPRDYRAHMTLQTVVNRIYG
jgi:hypothetical protein